MMKYIKDKILKYAMLTKCKKYTPQIDTFNRVIFIYNDKFINFK